MIFEGVKLMVVGMTTVMLFLCVMILFINFVAFLTRAAAERELQVIAKNRALRVKNKNITKEAAALDNADEEMAVIAAAVATYERERCAQA